MEKIDKTIIEITNGYTGDKLSISTGDDCDINDWKNHFTTILTFLTFHPGTIKELFYEEDV